jgi:Zn-dependent peptidase ImmA (M78 family)/transcriptional regulator with XRE-family HTH domain
VTRPDNPLRLLRSVENTSADVNGHGRPATARLDAVRLLFEPDRLRLARQLTRMKKNEIASGAGVTPAAISQYELGQSTPSSETLWRLALTLGVEVQFFTRPAKTPVQDASAAHFRSLRATSQLERHQAVAYSEVVWQVSEGLGRWVRLPDIAVPEHPVTTSAEPKEVEEAAAAVREELGLGLLPVPHVVRLAESRGIVVVRTPHRVSERVDAFSHWISGRPLIVLSSSKNDAARSRFDAAHELGHLVMHRDAHPGSAIAERQAHLFASCFMAPPQVLRDQLPQRADWKALMPLKQHHGMSLKSLAFAAHRLGLWSDAVYQRAMRQYSGSGWNQNEPGDIGPAERPSMIEKAGRLLIQNGVSTRDLASASGLTEDLVLEVIETGSDNTQPRPLLED